MVPSADGQEQWRPVYEVLALPAVERGNGRGWGGPGDAYRSLLELAALQAQPEPPQVGRWPY